MGAFGESVRRIVELGPTRVPLYLRARRFPMPRWGSSPRLPPFRSAAGAVATLGQSFVVFGHAKTCILVRHRTRSKPTNRSEHSRIHVKRIVSLVLLVCTFALPSTAQTVVLDNTNGYSVTIEPGVVLSRPGINDGPLVITGGEFAIGTSHVAVFPGQTQIGGSGGRLDGNRPRDLANGAISFTIRATTSGNLYDTVLTYWAGSALSNPAGTPPGPDNAAAAALTLQVVSVAEVPISPGVPAAIAFLSAILGARQLTSGRAGTPELSSPGSIFGRATPAPRPPL